MTQIGHINLQNNGRLYIPCSKYNHTWYGIGEYYSGTTNTTTTNVYWLLNFHTNILNTFGECIFCTTEKCKRAYLYNFLLYSYIICADGGQQLVYSNGVY